MRHDVGVGGPGAGGPGAGGPGAGGPGAGGPDTTCDHINAKQLCNIATLFFLFLAGVFSIKKFYQQKQGNGIPIIILSLLSEIK